MVKVRLPFMMFAFINLLVGMLAGLIRMGWDFPITSMTVHYGVIIVGMQCLFLVFVKRNRRMKINVWHMVYHCWLRWIGVNGDYEWWHRPPWYILSHRINSSIFFLSSDYNRIFFVQI